MEQKERKPRITVEIEPEIYESLREHLPWGTMTSVFNAIFKNLAELLEEHDPQFIIAAILSEDITLKDFLKDREDSDG